MDLVYTFRDDKRTGNSQLIYSLRSVDKYMFGVDKVFVIGHNPKLNNIIHIPFKDRFNPAKNITQKLVAIANVSDVSENFLYMADDYYLTAQVDANTYPAYINGTLPELYQTQNNAYRAMVKNTFMELRRRGLPENNFNIHVPFKYNKTKLREIASMYNLNNALNYLMKSLYANTFSDWHNTNRTTIALKDCKIRQNFPIPEIQSRIAGRDCWSSGKEWECPNILEYLNLLYPKKSKYEQ